MHSALLVACLWLSGVSEAVLLPSLPPRTAAELSTSSVENAFVTGSPTLAKRDPRKKAIVNKEWLKDESERVHGTKEKEEPLPAWIRTIYGSVVEVVKPTVIGGVTFSTKPPAETKGTEWWVSVKNDGSPKTIKPKIKNGQIKNGFPDVKTYFETATTIVHKQEDIKAHNLEEGDEVEEVVLIPEDNTYVKLSPLMRCTPDFYFKRGMAGMDKSEPFCKPRDNSVMRVGKTYFLMWYSRFYEDAKNVKFHYAFVREKLSSKGMAKKVKRAIRSPIKDVGADVAELSNEVGSNKGDVPGAFYSSDWVANAQGWFPVDVKKDWLHGAVLKKVLIAIQPDTVDDEDFSLIEAPHLVVEFRLKEIVGKNTKEMRKQMDMPGMRDDIYYVVMGIPTLVLVALFFMYMFVQANKKHRDLSGLRKPRRSRFGNQYTNTYAEMDLRKPDTMKQS